MGFRILIPDRLKDNADIEQQVFGSETIIELFNATSAKDIPDTVWSNCDAILAWHEIQYTPSLIQKMKNCKVIVRVGVGYDNVNLQAAEQNNIKVCNVPDYGTDDVADHAMAFILSLSRGLPEYESAARKGDWSWETGVGLRRLKGSNLGIIGLGRIGTAVALRAKAFGLNVLFYDPYKPQGIEKSLSLERVDSLYELAEKSRIITIHAPLTSETSKMIDEGFFNTCNKGTILVNTARGGIIDFDHLHDAMLNEIIYKTGLDVLPVEPADLSHPLIKKWKENNSDWERRIQITPHCAFYNAESYVEMRRKAAEEALRVLNNLPTLYEISNG